MKNLIQIASNKLSIIVYAYSKNVGKYVRYPGFTTIQCPGRKSKKPEFICGIGAISELGEKLNGLYVGQSVVFCGFTDAEIDEYIVTTVNNIAVLQSDKIKEESALCGYIANFISIINKLKPTIGFNVALYGDERTGKILSQLLKAFGCNVYIISNILNYDFDKENTLENKGADAAIIFNDDITEEHISYISKLCIKTAPIVIASVGSPRISPDCIIGKIVFCNDTGDGFFDENYMTTNMTYPIHYINTTTSKNLALAFELISKGKIELTKGKDFISYMVDSKTGNIDNTVPRIVVINREMYSKEKVSIYHELRNNEIKLPKYIEKLVELYRNHINPCFLKITCQYENMQEGLSNHLLLMAANILKCNIKSFNVVSNQKGLKCILISCIDGSVLSLSLIKSNSVLCDVRIEMHYDGTTIKLFNNILKVYQGDSVTSENQKIDIADKICESTEQYFKVNSDLSSWKQLLDNLNDVTTN